MALYFKGISLFSHHINITRLGIWRLPTSVSVRYVEAPLPVFEKFYDTRPRALAHLSTVILQFSDFFLLALFLCFIRMGVEKWTNETCATFPTTTCTCIVFARSHKLVIRAAEASNSITVSSSCQLQLSTAGSCLVINDASWIHKSTTNRRQRSQITEVLLSAHCCSLDERARFISTGLTQRDWRVRAYNELLAHAWRVNRTFSGDTHRYFPLQCGKYRYTEQIVDT